MNNRDQFKQSVIKDIAYLHRYGVGSFTIDMPHWECLQPLCSYLDDEQLNQVTEWAIQNLVDFSNTIDELGEGNG